MKKFYILCLMAMASSLAMANDLVTTATKLEKNKVVEEASDTAKWTFPGCSVGLNLNQMYFNDYSTEGEGVSVAMDAFLNLNAVYTRNKVMWENNLAAKYGMIYSNQFLEPYYLRKNLDELFLNTKYGYKVSKAWYVSAFANLETQFTNGYEYPEDELEAETTDRDTISQFFAPATIKISLGMEYIPNKYFSAFISPVTARLTVCRNDKLGGNYGMEFIDEDIIMMTNRKGNPVVKHVKHYEKFRAEVGAYFKLKSDFDVTKSLHLFSTLEGFYSYNKAVQTYTSTFIDSMTAVQNRMYRDNEMFDPEAISYNKEDLKDVHGWYLKWKLELLMKVSKYVNISFKTQLKYDNAETKLVKSDHKKVIMDNDEECILRKYENGGLKMPGLQFWESTSIGVAYTFK